VFVFAFCDVAFCDVAFSLGCCNGNSHVRRDRGDGGGGGAHNNTHAGLFFVSFFTLNCALIPM
jgi:hypothetical protein